jgi:PBP1b-binding outer membrane lipoprotein LpoB
MANAAAGYSLGDISSLLFSGCADASTAPQSKKKKQAAPPALADPFATHVKTADNAFAETARAQVAAGMRRKDADEEKLQAAEGSGDGRHRHLRPH